MTTQTDTTTSRRAPRQRRTATTIPKGYDKAHRVFEDRAHDWLLGRPDRIVSLPEELRPIVGLGVPCRTCGNQVFGFVDGHSISWSRVPDGHWASGIIADCAPNP